MATKTKQAQTLAILGEGRAGRQMVQKVCVHPSPLSVLVVDVSGGTDFSSFEIDLANFEAQPTTLDEAIGASQDFILATDAPLIPEVAARVVPHALPGSLFLTTESAVASSGRLPLREGISYFLAHGCHPSLFQPDIVGGKARQSVVCALIEGSEQDYERGVEIARVMYAPVLRMHRVTVEQFSLLDPTLVEMVALGLLTGLKEAMDEVVSRGVPAEAARDFLLGHFGGMTRVTFEVSDNMFSDGAYLSAAQGRARLFRDDWKGVFEPEAIRKNIAEMLS